MYNPVEWFFMAIAEGNLTKALETVNDNVVFEAQGPKSVPIYGRFEGKEGVKKFVNTLSDLFSDEVRWLLWAPRSIEFEPGINTVSIFLFLNL